MSFFMSMAMLSDDAFDFDTGMMAEIHKEGEAMAGSFQIIMDLRAMFIAQRGDGFEFDDQLPEADEIRLKLGGQLAALVFKL